MCSFLYTPLAVSLQISSAIPSTCRWSHRLYTVTCHPEEPYFVTGDSQGKIIIWRGVLSAKTPEPVTTVLHWHAHAVKTLCFNSDGTYLLSGGEEAVLTLWQMLTGKRRFLPRLGAPLAHVTVSADDAFYIVSCADNSIKMLDSATLNATMTFQGLKRGVSPG